MGRSRQESFDEPPVAGGLAALSVLPESFDFGELSDDPDVEEAGAAEAESDFSPFDSLAADSPPDFLA
jgi:hypothetical protein